MCHLGALTFLAFFLSFATGVLPQSPPPVVRISATPTPSLWTTTLVLTALSMVMVLSLPMSPSLYYPPSLAYPSAVTSTTSPPSTPNVCGSTSASLFSLLVFSYVTPVVYLGHVLPSIDILDLPILPAIVRSTYNFTVFRSQQTTINSPWALAKKIIAINRNALVYMLFLVSTTAFLFYTPAFFLQRLVAYLEADPHRENRGWGWVYVIGLFGALSLINLGAHLVPLSGTVPG
jgi:hypothetical protein